jgi:C4-dicarboxylate-specific signal transduction histidine kinase
VERLGQLSRRIATIVRSFKLLSHSETNDPMTDATVGTLVEATLDIVRGRCKPLGVELSVHIDAPQQPLHCRIVALSQVVLNLLNNSCDAVGDLKAGERWIRIDSTALGNTVQLSVTDSGRIESRDVQAKMFDPFFTTKPIGKGTGLGLSISKQTVEQHGGRLYVDASSVNTRLVIELPARSAAPPDRMVA